MTYGYRSKSGRFTKSNFRSPRGSPRGRSSSFRGRGRGGTSDSYYASSSRDSFSEKPTFRGNSFSSSSYRGRDDHYDSYGSGSRYSGERYSTRGRRPEVSSVHHREIRESASGSYGREHSRRSDSESDRKRISSSYKEGYSPRRSYDELEHSSRSYSNSNSSPYHSESSLYGGKSHTKEFNDFKKPLPPDRTSYSRRPLRGSRGRGSCSTRIATSRILKTPSSSYLKRSSTVSRMKTATRLQQVLRKKKQLRIMRMRKDRETRQHSSSTGKPNIDDNTNIEVDETDDFVDEDIDMGEVGEEDLEPPGVSSVEKKSSRKVTGESNTSPEKSATQSDSSKEKERTFSPTRATYRIALKCPHCKLECKTFKSYHHHLTSHRHKVAMEKLLYNMKQKLRRMRTEQREQQRIIDERDDNFNRTSYCKLCKLNFKQTRQEHMTSDFHVSMSEFLSLKCSVCRMTFGTPILYEHHRCTLAHIKRKAFLERKGVLKSREKDEENNDDGNFMVLDSVGSADESNEELDTSKEDGNSGSSKKKTALETEKKTTIIGNEYIKKVNIYYCKLCKLCLHYNPNRNAEDGLLNHCRTRFHLKRFSLEEDKKKITEKKNAPSTDGELSEKKLNDSLTADKDGDGEENEQFWVDDEVMGDEHKSSEDEDDSQSGNRYDRFSTSDEKDNVEKIKVEPEDVDDKNSKSIDAPQNGSGSKDS